MASHELSEDGLCVLTCKDENCASCKEAAVCIRCNDGFYLTEEGTCAGTASNLVVFIDKVSC